MKIIAAVAALLSLPASAAPFDYLLIGTDAATLLADPAIAAAAGDGQGGFRADICIPNVQRWNSLQDVTGTDGNGNPTVTHTFMVNWAVICTFQSHQPALDTDPATYLVTDRGAAQAGLPFIVLTPYFTVGQLQTLMLQPTPAGSNYAFLNAALIQQRQ